MKRFLLLFLVMSSFVFGDIVESDSLNVIRSYQLDEKTLVLFDVDMVLVVPENPAFSLRNIETHRAVLKNLMTPLSPLQKDEALNRIAMQPRGSLVHESLPQLFSLLRKYGVRIGALTSTFSGEFECLEAHICRCEKLNKLGLSFSCFTPEKLDLGIHGENGRRALLYKGILFANGQYSGVSKGEVLTRFLELISWKPKRVIFVDDRLSNVESVEKALLEKQPDIEFRGIHFTGKPQNGSLEVSIDQFKEAWTDVISSKE